MYKNQWIEVYEDDVVTPWGNKGIYGYLELHDAVCILPIDKDGATYMIKEYRYPTKEYLWTFVGGSYDKNKSYQELAKDELLEETNIKANVIEKIGAFYQEPSLLTFKHILFVAQELDTSNVNKKIDTDAEIIEVKRVNKIEISEMIKRDEIIDAKALAALALLNAKRPDLFR